MRFFLFLLAVSKLVCKFAIGIYKTGMTMETKKFKQVPSINRVGGRNPLIPRPVVVSCGTKKKSNGRYITRPMRTNSRPLSAGEPINWDEVYC